MNDKELEKTLERAFPDTPKVFHDRMLEAARPMKREGKAMKKRVLLKTALVCAVILSMTGVAVAAANHYGVFNFNPNEEEAHYFTLPGAEDMIRYDLAEAKTGDLVWKVKEAAYDGRVLRILYSVRYTGASIPWQGEDAMDAYYSLAMSAGVGLQADGNGEILVNGWGVNLQNVSARYGEEPGEILCWMDCRMEGSDGERLKPEGSIAVSMPFSFHSEESKAAADRDALAFTLEVGDAASRYALRLPEPCTLDNGTRVTFTDLHFSPVTVFIDAEITVPVERITAPDKEDPDAYWAWIDTVPEYAAAFDPHLENADGEKLGEWKDGALGDRINADGSLTIVLHCENTPSEKYTAVNYLCFGEWKVPIPMEYAAR